MDAAEPHRPHERNEMEIPPGDFNLDPDDVFDLMDKLGEGSYGSVVKARHKPSGEIYAVKLVPAETDSTKNLMQEVEMMRTLRSDFVIRQFGTYFAEGYLWIVLEYCPGASLADYLRITRRTFTEGQISTICKDVLRGLDYLHVNKLIHRDIKAGNILIGQDARAKLADFGVAGQLSDTTLRRRTLTGTPYWMAPEVLGDGGYDGRADIWSLGITCIELSDGKPPYSSFRPMLAMMMIPSKPAPRIPDEHRFSKTFIDFVDQMLVKNPDDRPTANALLWHPFILENKNPGLRMVLEEMSEHIAQGALDPADEEYEEGAEVEGGTVRYSDSTAVRYSDSTAVRYSDSTAVQYSDTTAVRYDTVPPTSSSPTTSADTAPSVDTVAPQLANLSFSQGGTLLRRRSDAPSDGTIYDSAAHLMRSGTLRRASQPALQRLPHILIWFSDETNITVDVSKEYMSVGRFSETAAPAAIPDLGSVTNFIYFTSKVLSRTHCAFGKDDVGYFVMDLGSSSCTFVNGKALSERGMVSAKHYLQQLDVVKLGVSVRPDGSLVGDKEEDRGLPRDRRAMTFNVVYENDVEARESRLVLTVSAAPTSMNVRKVGE